MFAAFSRMILPPMLLLTALLGYRAAYQYVPRLEPTIARNEPHIVTPLYDWPAAVTDEQLFRVLDRVKPLRSRPLTNNLVHALRLWGPKADFGDVAIPSGPEMRAYLLDDAAFQRLAGDNAPPLWTKTADGVRPRNFEDDFSHSTTASYHVDDLLATLAESGVPLDEPMQLRQGAATVRDALDAALHSFFLKRHEYEWSMISYIRYAHPLTNWRNRYGEPLDVVRLVEEMINHPFDAGPCNGLHRLEAMVLLHRVDEESATIPEATRRRMLTHMKRVSRLLETSQSVEGFWSRQWSEGSIAQRTDATSVPMSDRILVTGHQLEWLALAPPEVLPPRETIVRACQWLARTLPELDEADIAAHYGPYTHAARALCLWRSRDPFEAWQSGREATK